MTCLNVAIVLAHQGKRTLLVDADMRRPSIHRALDLKGQVGLSNILTGSANVRDAIQATIQPNLFAISAGPIPPHPSELLSSSLMQDFMQKWCEDYDHVIVDSPPVLSVTDPVLLSVQMDAVILIVRSGQTTVAHVRRTCDLLQSVNARLLGIVVNAADLASPDYYQYHYGSRYYHYNEKQTNGHKAVSNGHGDANENINQERDQATTRSS
jgi:capsular exopolysaccharide synthesis family protein